MKKLANIKRCSKLIRKHLFAGVLQYSPSFNINDSIAKIDGINLAKNILRKSENNINKGFHYVTDRWYPHKSVEGGADTIAYGIKLQESNDPHVLKWVDLSNNLGYLTGLQTELALDNYINRYRESAKLIYDNVYGKGAFDKLLPYLQAIAIDIQYNGGLGKFTKFMEAMHNNDIEGLIKESRRYLTTETGKKIPLGRNKEILQMILDYNPLYLNDVLMTDLKPTIYITR